MAKLLQAIYPVILLVGKTLPTKSKYYIHLVSFIIYFLLSNNLASQTSIQSVNDGSWNSTNTWQGGGIPTAADNATINNIDTIKSGTTAEVIDLTISSTGKLVVEGTLIVSGDLKMEDSKNDPSELILAPNSVTIVKNNVTLSTKVDLNLSSFFIVMGDLDAQSSGTNTNINITEASIYIFGTVSDKTDLESCDAYDGLTEDNSEFCHVGTDSAFYNNIDSIPTEIIEIVNGCDPPTANISGNNGPLCSGEDVEFYLSGTSNATVIYNINGDSNSTINLTSGSATLTVSNVTTSQTLNLVSVNDGTCSQSLSESSTVTVNQFNMIISDATLTPSGGHCPEFGGPFNPNNSDYNAGVTEVIFKVIKEEFTTGNWTFDFGIDETGDVEVYDLVSVTGNNSTIAYNNDVAGGSIDATDNTEVTFTFQIWNVPGTTLDVDFMVSNGNDGNCDETGNLTDNNEIHTINGMPVVGTFNP
jgi:hypothetical protein